MCSGPATAYSIIHSAIGNILPLSFESVCSRGVADYIHIFSIMDPILSSIVVQAGKNLIGNLVGVDRAQPVRPQDSEGRMARFEERLQQVMDPVKADLKGFLESNRVKSVQGLEALEARLINGLVHSKEVASVDMARGGIGKWDLVCDSGNLRLESDRGDWIEVDPNGDLGMGAQRLLQVRQLLEQAQLTPGLPFHSLINSSSANPGLAGGVDASNWRIGLG